MVDVWNIGLVGGCELCRSGDTRSGIIMASYTRDGTYEVASSYYWGMLLGLVHFSSGDLGIWDLGSWMVGVYT